MTRAIVAGVVAALALAGCATIVFPPAAGTCGPVAREAGGCSVSCPPGAAPHCRDASRGPAAVRCWCWCGEGP